MVRGRAQGVPGMRGQKGQKCPFGLREGGHKRGPYIHFNVHGTLSCLSSEFSSALEYLKLLNSFVDSVGVVTPPFSSSSVLKSALGKHLAGLLPGLGCLLLSFIAPLSQGPGLVEYTLENLLDLRFVSSAPPKP